MIVDASALLAMIFRERGHEELFRKIAEADVLAIGAPTVVEAGIVLTSRLGENDFRRTDFGARLGFRSAAACRRFRVLD